MYFVATTVYETENCGGDNITPGEDVSRTNSDFGVSGCRCEANTNVPGAPRIFDPPLSTTPLLNILSESMMTTGTHIEDYYKQHFPWIV